MSVVAVGSDGVIILAEQGDGAHSHSFLADVKVEEATHFSGLVFCERDLLKRPDAGHLTEQVDLPLAAELLVDGV